MIPVSNVAHNGASKAQIAALSNNVFGGSVPLYQQSRLGIIAQYCKHLLKA